MTTGKIIASTRWTSVGKVMSLFFNMLSRLVITFLPRSKRLLISWLQSPSAVILELPKIKYLTVSPSISHEVMGPDAMILVFWMLSFRPTFSLSFSLSLRDSLFAFYHRGGFICISEVIDISPRNLDSSYASSSPAFLIMYSAYKLNKQGDNVQPWCTPFLIWNQSVVPCPVLTGFLICIQVSQEAGQVVWYSHFLKNFPECVVIHTVKGFGVVNKADDFLELLLFRWSSGCRQFDLWFLWLF